MKFKRLGQQKLGTEQLEKRELLAADFCCLGAAIPLDTSQIDDVAIVHDQVQVAAFDVTLESTQPQEQSRANEDRGAAEEDAALKRPRDRVSEDTTVIASTSLAAATVEPTVAGAQPQEQSRTNEDRGAAEEDAALKRPRDRVSDDAS